MIDAAEMSIAESKDVKNYRKMQQFLSDFLFLFDKPVKATLWFVLWALNKEKDVNADKKKSLYDLVCRYVLQLVGCCLAHCRCVCLCVCEYLH